MPKSATRVFDDAAIENVRARVARELRKLPRVDSQGRVVDPNSPTSVAVIGAPLPPEVPATPPVPASDSLAIALTTVAAAAGADIDALTDSVSFMRAVIDVESTDTPMLTKLVSDSMAANPRLRAIAPTMKPNPGQGASGHTPAPKSRTVAERVAERLAKTPPVNAQGHVVK